MILKLILVHEWNGQDRRFQYLTKISNYVTKESKFCSSQSKTWACVELRKIKKTFENSKKNESYSPSTCSNQDPELCKVAYLDESSRKNSINSGFRFEFITYSTNHDRNFFIETERILILVILSSFKSQH